MLRAEQKFQLADSEAGIREAVQRLKAGTLPPAEATARIRDELSMALIAVGAEGIIGALIAARNAGAHV